MKRPYLQTIYPGITTHVKGSGTYTKEYLEILKSDNIARAENEMVCFQSLSSISAKFLLLECIKSKFPEMKELHAAIEKSLNE